MFQSLFYWITYSYNNIGDGNYVNTKKVSILILLDYLFLSIKWCSFSIFCSSFNPYFTGLPILITRLEYTVERFNDRFQSLFYWITYSYSKERIVQEAIINLFQSLFYWITYSYILISFLSSLAVFVSILILLDYLFL